VKGGVKAAKASKEIAQGTKATKSVAKAEQAAQRAERVEYTTKVAKAEERVVQIEWGSAAKAAKIGPRGVQILQQVLPNTEAFFENANTVWKNGAQGTLSVAGRALQKHSGRAGSAFSNIKFSGKTANQEAMKVIKEIMYSKNRVIQVTLHGTIDIYDSVSRRGFNISRRGLFSGFRSLKNGLPCNIPQE
jgi:hypothetical protein